MTDRKYYVQAQIAVDKICDTCSHSMGSGCRIFRTTCDHFHDGAANTVNIDKCDTDPQSDTVVIFHIPVKKSLLDRYVSHIASRLETADNDPAMQAYSHERIFHICGLEHEREELHTEILHDAGFEPFDMSPEAIAFRYAVEEYIEQRVKRFGLPRIFVVPKQLKVPIGNRRNSP